MEVEFKPSYACTAFTGVRRCSPVLSSELSSKSLAGRTCKLHLERVRHSVYRRISLSTLVSQPPTLCGFSFATVRCRLPAFLSRLLSEKRGQCLRTEAPWRPIPSAARAPSIGAVRVGCGSFLGASARITHDPDVMPFGRLKSNASTLPLGLVSLITRISRCRLRIAGSR
jgi:hypothetical protein